MNNNPQNPVQVDDYWVISDNSATWVASEVKRYLQNGWHLLGTLSITHSPRETWYAQAVCKMSDKE